LGAGTVPSLIVARDRTEVVIERDDMTFAAALPPIMGQPGRLAMSTGCF
jgi:hypothetical protein